MAAHLYQTQLALSSSYPAVESAACVLCVNLLAPATNNAAISVRFAGGTAYEWQPGTQVVLESVDVSAIEAMCAPDGNVLLVVGQSRVD